MTVTLALFDRSRLLQWLCRRLMSEADAFSRRATAQSATAARFQVSTKLTCSAVYPCVRWLRCEFATGKWLPKMKNSTFLKTSRQRYTVIYRSCLQSRQCLVTCTQHSSRPAQLSNRSLKSGGWPWRLTWVYGLAIPSYYVLIHMGLQVGHEVHDHVD